MPIFFFTEIGKVSQKLILLLISLINLANFSLCIKSILFKTKKLTLKFDTNSLIFLNKLSLITFEESKIKRFRSHESNSSNNDLDIFLLKKRLSAIIPGVSTKINRLDFKFRIALIF